MQEFKLLEDEEIIEDIKPLPKLKTYFRITYGISAIIALPFLFVAPFVLLYGSSNFSYFISVGIWGLILLLLGIILLVAPIGILPELAYNKHHYWITNKRIIIKRGLIGYSITSIPYERISDIIISRSFLERFVGIASLHVQSLAGQYSYGRFGGEGALLAVPNPEELQAKLMELVKKKRQEERLAF